MYGKSGEKAVDQNVHAGNKAEGTTRADTRQPPNPIIEKGAAVGLQRQSAPLEFSEIKVGRKYIITDQFDSKGSINAPLYADVPGRSGGLAEKIGQLEPNRPFTVRGIYRTPRKGYGWLRVQADAAGSQPLSGWLPWGPDETPMVPATRD
jgi:hypothetical protein